MAADGGAGAIGFPADDGAVVPLYGGGAWAAETRRRLGAVLGGGETEARRALAGAVERFLREEGIDRRPLPDAYLDLLVFRGLRAAGQDDDARRWAAARLPARNGPEPFDPDVWPGPVPLVVWELFASGMVRPFRTLAADGRLAWILDFRRMGPGEAGWMDLTLFPGLRRMLEILAPAWDPGGGRGTLGLRGLGESGLARKDAEAVGRHCGAVLARLAAARGWKRTPEIVWMDFAGKRK